MSSRATSTGSELRLAAALVVLMLFVSRDGFFHWHRILCSSDAHSSFPCCVQ